MKNNERLMVLVVDYKNIADTAAPEYKILDFKKLREKSLEIAPVIACFVFIPDHWANKISMAEAQKYGFFVMCCYGVKDFPDTIEDSVDIWIIKLIKDIIIPNRSITDICLVGSDRHMNHWIQSAQWAGKKIHIFSGKNLSHVLKDAVNPDDIHQVPLKDGEI